MIEAVLKGLGFGLLLSIAVGPVLFSIIKQSLNNGYRGGFAFVFGVFFSDITLVLISNVFTQFFDSIQVYKIEVGIAGSALLITIGIYFLFFKKVKVNEEGKQVFKFRKRDFAKIFISGFFMNSLNPGVFIFWITTSTAVITHTVNERIIIFATCLLFMVSSDTLKVLLAGKIRSKINERVIRLINKVSGLILIGFGVVLMVGVFYASRLSH